MARRIARTVALAFAVGGFLALLGMLATPWARVTVKAGGRVNLDRALGVSVFRIHLGGWYLALLIATAALLSAALAGERNWRRPSGGLTFVVGVVDAGLAVMIGGSADAMVGAAHVLGFTDVSVRGVAGPGVWFGIVAPLLLGIGGALAAAGEARDRGVVEGVVEAPAEGGTRPGP